jgi:hypothetical protein|tara:strand:+ start:1414 stop:1833 length:420 start_codon:yes stop_codon:yes gene_type:complete
MKKTRLTQFIDNARSFSIGEAIEIFLGENTMATTAKNYTDEMVASMTEAYQANPTRETVDSLASKFGKTTRSIIAKLSREGVYVAQPRTTKSGEPVVSKCQFVAAIEAHFHQEMPTLVKSGKQDLQKLADALGLEVHAS